MWLLSCCAEITALRRFITKCLLPLIISISSSNDLGSFIPQYFFPGSHANVRSESDVKSRARDFQRHSAPSVHRFASSSTFFLEWPQVDMIVSLSFSLIVAERVRYHRLLSIFHSSEYNRRKPLTGRVINFLCRQTMSLRLQYQKYTTELPVVCSHNVNTDCTDLFTSVNFTNKL